MPLVSPPPFSTSTFWWGTATAAYQIEGGNENTDWWRFETKEGSICAAPCGPACDSWNRWGEDLDLVAGMGLDAYRFSVEWSRIEPERGRVDRAALERYRRMVEGCRDRGIAPVVTLHHFTLPLWVAGAGGFEAPGIVGWLADYVALVGDALGDELAMACTLNEPNIVAAMGYLAGLFPPGASDRGRFVAVNETMRRCHEAMRDALRAGPGDYPVGLTLSMAEYEALEGGEATLEAYRTEMEDRYLATREGDDFLGVQCYTKHLVDANGLVWGGEGELTSMGYPFWPESVGFTLRRAARAGVPLVVTENGIGTDDDVQRVRYLEGALASLGAARAEGVDVRGYFQWSLLDNFEWVLGYGPRFGLVEVDRTTFARTPKSSAAWYAERAAAWPAGPRGAP